MATAAPHGMLQSLIETTVDGVLTIDAKGIVSVFNTASEKLFGYAREEVIGRNISMLMPDHYARDHDHFIGRYLSTGEARIIGIGRRVEGLRKCGKVFPMDLSVGAFQHEGAPMFVGVVRDLTDRVEDERRMSQLQSQLNHMGRVGAVAEMGSALAHELNQPLTAVALFLASAERTMETDPEKTRALFARARTETLRAGEIVRRIRQMVEQSEYDPRDFDLDETIEAAVELCKIADSRHAAEIRVDHEAGRTAFGDPTQVQQVLFNLIKNGIDASEAVEKPIVRVTTRLAGKALEVFVEDNGSGVAPDFREHLFTPFETTKAGGLGIGLSICRNIAELHGGSLDLADASPHNDSLGGAVFRLRLPAAEIEA